MPLLYTYVHLIQLHVVQLNLDPVLELGDTAKWIDTTQQQIVG